VRLAKWRIPDYRHIADLAKRFPYRILDIITRFSSSRINILFLFSTQISFILHRKNLLTNPEELDADVLRRVRHALNATGILKNNRGKEEHLMATFRAERGIARHSQ
jgi:hypothetical protein